MYGQQISPAVLCGQGKTAIPSSIRMKELAEINLETRKDNHYLYLISA